jgi:A/G-specific adenine glycosylase
MKKQPRIRNVRQIRRSLNTWYDENKRDLPWRNTNDPYRIWVSEVMLQQTQVKTVIPYYRRFLKRFPTLGSLAASDQQALLKVWEGLGYYGRARNLHCTANRVVGDFNGTIPNNWRNIRQLPGIGDYIAAAVLSIAYDQPHAVVDGNVKRVFARLFKIDTPVNQSSSAKVFKALADRLLDPKSPGKSNQAIMELGALVCKPAAPYCGSCPLQSHCKALKSSTVDIFPKRLKTKPVPRHHVAIGVVFKKQKLLITQRRDDGLLGGLWEFPGGRIVAPETPEEACIREIKEEVNLNVKIRHFLTRINHAYTHFKITADVFICDFLSGRVSLNGAVDHKWIEFKEIDQYPFPKANHKFIPLLKEL